MSDLNGRAPKRAAMRPENRVAIAVGAITLVAGIVVLVLGGGGTGATIAAAMLLGIAGIAFVSLVFLIVGQSEEDDRERHPRG
jgi:dipeptide/tripeptide permease